jgi:hypothetical protein
MPPMENPEMPAKKASGGDRHQQPQTVVRMPEDLKREAQHYAIDNRMTLKEVIELALREKLARERGRK